MNLIVTDTKVTMVSVVLGVHLVPFIFSLAFFSEKIRGLVPLFMIVFPVLWITIGHYFSKFLGSPVKALLLAHMGTAFNLLIGLGMWLYLEPESMRAFGKLIDGDPVLTLAVAGSCLPFILMAFAGEVGQYLWGFCASVILSMMVFAVGSSARSKYPWWALVWALASIFFFFGAIEFFSWIRWL